jgi:hypothetical protein
LDSYPSKYYLGQTLLDCSDQNGTEMSNVARDRSSVRDCFSFNNKRTNYLFEKKNLRFFSSAKNSRFITSAGGGVGARVRESDCCELAL